MSEVESNRQRVDLPELGTREAAVQTCVNLISRATGKPEGVLAYWLDLYYQIRITYEAELAGAFSLGDVFDEAAPARSETPLTKTTNEVAAEKRLILDRLTQARVNGVTVPQIVAAGRGRITEEQIRGILEHQKYGINVYRALNRALAKLSGSAGADAAEG